MSKQHHFNYIIAGAGLSGLSLAWYMLHSALADKKLLVVDQNLTPENKKTWSFWHEGAPPFQEVIHKSWRQVKVGFEEQTIKDRLKTYTYHSIRSGTFQKYVLDELRRHPSVMLHEGSIESMQFNKKAILQSSRHTFTADYIFQSCLNPPALAKDRPDYPLIQHFLGWEVSTSRPVFDPQTVTLMDFDMGYEGGIAFIYILPQTPQKAMIEYTIFSDSLEEQTFYKGKLELYLHNKFNLRPLDYKIERSEYGKIPMQDHCYAPWYAKNILNMGTIGGLTKPSTGYTFSRIQQHAQAIVKQLLNDKQPALPLQSSFRYRAYDLWLLQIIHDQPRVAVQIFRQLFSNNTMDEVFRFLSEQNTLPQDLKMMSRVSYPPFFRAMWETKKRLLQLS